MLFRLCVVTQYDTASSLYRALTLCSSRLDVSTLSELCHDRIKPQPVTKKFRIWSEA